MTDKVKDDEIVYRRLLYNKEHYAIEDGNKIRVRVMAFADPGGKPSVDRTILCQADPTWTQRGYNPNGGTDYIKNCVVSLIAGEIRSIDYAHAGFKYQVDVVPRPLDYNPAHAQIEVNPPHKSKSAFKRLLQALTNLANSKAQWPILPLELRKIE